MVSLCFLSNTSGYATQSAGQAPPNKGRKFPGEPLADGELRLILRACSQRAPTGIRNRALIIVMYRAGLRVSEALALRPADLDAVHDHPAAPVIASGRRISPGLPRTRL